MQQAVHLETLFFATLKERLADQAQQLAQRDAGHPLSRLTAEAPIKDGKLRRTAVSAQRL